MHEIARPDFSRLGPPAGGRLLVIGGCGGIGHAFTEHARTQGLLATVLDIRESIERRGMTGDPQHIAVDLRDEASIENAFRQLERRGARFEGMAICSGYTKGSDRISSLDTDRFDDILSGNLRGPVLALRAGCRVLTDDAAVVVLTTAIGQLGTPGYAGYGAAKAGLNAIIRILAAELAPGVRVNGVAPGAVDTAFIRGGYNEGGAETGSAERFDIHAYVQKIPLQRMGESDDIVGPMLFLLSHSARYITGQVLHVNGGGFMRD